jgi:hypothetical protein
MSRSRKSSATTFERAPLGVLPPPELLEVFTRFGPEMPAKVLRLWGDAHVRAYRYAILSLVIGGLLGLALIGGFIYLVMQGHGTYAGVLQGAGALSMVAGFRSTRLDH